MLQRQGEIGPDGEPVRPTQEDRARATRTAPGPERERTSPRTYLHEVRGELRKVAWPTRAEVARYSLIVLLTLIVLTSLIFGLDYAFANSVLFLFGS